MDSGCFAFGLRAGLGIEQVAKFPAAAKSPALFCDEIDSGGVRKSALRRGGLITFLNIDAGAVAEPRLHAGDQAAPASAVDQLIVVGPLIFQPIVQVKTGPLGIEKAGADLSAGTKISVRRLTINPEAFRQAIRSAHAGATVVWTAAACRDRVLAENVSAPGVTWAVFYLRDRVRALTLFLSQWHNRRIVLTHIVAHAGAEAPSISHPIAQVHSIARVSSPWSWVL